MINRDYIYMLIFCNDILQSGKILCIAKSVTWHGVNRNQLKKIFHKNKETYIENSYEMF